MCGFGAILRTDGAEIPGHWLDAVDALVCHRGPDGHRRWCGTGGPGGRVRVAMTHHRLAIIDPADGAQPMVARPHGDERDSIAVAFNGCIYNHREVREELRRSGYRFATDHSDTEVLLHGWRQWGKAIIDHIEGMYAAAIWCGESGSLHLLRDPFGQKPLYEAELALGAGSVKIVSSSALAVAHVLALAQGAASPRIDFTPPLLTGYLRFGHLPPDGDTPWVSPDGCSRVRSVPRSSRLGADVSAGIDAEHDSIGRMGRRADLVAALEEALSACVQSVLESDVPLGCLLSGGVDSSIVAALARRHAGSLHTFCLRMPDPRYDESAYAARVAQALGCEHETIDAPDHAAEDLLAVLQTLGLPFGDSSILPTTWLCRAVRRRVHVALTGDGGDELCFGYDRHRAAAWPARLAPIAGLIPRSSGASAHPRSALHRFHRLVGLARDWRFVGLRAWRSIFDHRQLVALLGKHVDEPSPLRASGAASAVRQEDLDAYLPGDLLVKSDTASMAHALELRAPMLERRFAAAALAIAPSSHLAGGRKGLLRALARRVVPSCDADRPKSGFAVPLDAWFREDFGGLGSLLGAIVGDHRSWQALPIEPRAVDALLAEHREGNAQHAQRLFVLLSLGAFMRHAEVTSP